MSSNSFNSVYFSNVRISNNNNSDLNDNIFKNYNVKMDLLLEEKKKEK